MSIRQKIRDYLDSCDTPQWSCEIVSATGCKPSTISGMVLDGALVRHTDAVPHSYSIGVRPRGMSDADRMAKRDARNAKRNEKLKAQRRAAGIPPRRALTVKRTQIVLASKHETVGGESVAEYLARGGRIERLPGFQRDNVYPQRRPQMGNYRGMSA